MHPAGQFHNGPIWYQDDRSRLPAYGANLFGRFPQQRFPVNSYNHLNQQPLLMPLMPQPLLRPSPQAFMTSTTPAQPWHKRRRKNQGSLSQPSKKKARLSKGSIECDDDDSSRDSTPSPLTDKFVVPINHGTEKITMAIWDYFLASKMTEDDLKKKLLLRKSLLYVLEDAFPKCRLYIVGSSMTGFATRTSDVDMCLVIADDEVHQKREATVVLSVIAKALKHCSFVQGPQVIRAKVPILKFRDRVSHLIFEKINVKYERHEEIFPEFGWNVECDLNINNIIGVRNTHLLRYYACIDWRVRPLMLFIKHWARFHDINDASKKTISSYSLSLMLIHYLQAGVQPPVLPCLQKIRPDLFSGSCDVRSLSLCMEEIDFTSKNNATLGQLFLGFLQYYTKDFRCDTDLISVRTGKRLFKYNVVDDPSQWKHLCIEEPFEGSNTARSVYDFYVFQRICRVFSVSFHRLQQQRDCKAIVSQPF